MDHEKTPDPIISLQQKVVIHPFNRDAAVYFQAPHWGRLKFKDQPVPGQRYREIQSRAQGVYLDTISQAGFFNA
jgi:hypothetical protein